ncbi:hypothetical protein Syun_004669 [Stephania yunnanensis]|uniref:Uncharacterized protein n=1 Tax=Stephania yunnanensis TaxID=152371 RepID=A0AAP0L3G6_9MAGN
MHARDQRAVMGAVSNTSSRGQRAVDRSVSGEIAESGDRRESGEGATSMSGERGERGAGSGVSGDRAREKAESVRLGLSEREGRDR